jgi:hyperosmotically inducible protein
LLRKRSEDVMSSRLTRTLQAALLVTVGFVVPGFAQQHVPLTDQQIASQVEHRLVDGEIRGVVVTVRDRTVTLSGTVRSLWAKEEAIEEARKVNDVKDVVSTLTVMHGESDQSVGEAVAAKLRRYVFFSIFDDVEVEVTAGVATLTGYVTMPYKAQAMVKLASRVDAVQQVIDKLETLPVSGFDDQIRYAAAIRIYNDPLFWNYAIQVDPPIHIVVKNGRVTLTGVVISEVERRKAEQIAREVFGVLSVENKLRLER